jgi:hypothetical protein
VAESFFGSLKTELLYRNSWASRHDAELAIFAWIEGWYNPERLIAGMRSPDEYEAAFYADTTNANLNTTVKVGNHESSLQETGEPSLPTEQAPMRCLYLVTRSLDPKGTGQRRWATRWKPALNAFAITFADRMPTKAN